MTNEDSPIQRLRDYDPVAEIRKAQEQYFAARFIELHTVFDTLLARAMLRQENLDDSVVDLGTGSGIGLLALRKHTTGPLHGVDWGTFFEDDIFPFDSYSGRYAIPTPSIITEANATFERAYNTSYLKQQPENSLSLLTNFYIEVDQIKFLGDLYDEAHRVLKPCGQFLLTSDSDLRIPEEYVEHTAVIKGDEGPDKLLRLPVTDAVRQAYGHLISFAQPYYLDHVINTADAISLGCFRDRSIVVYTKES